MNNNANKKKQDRQNVYVTVTVILMMVAVVVAIAVSLAKNPAEPVSATEDTAGAFEGASLDRGEETEAEKKEKLDTQDVFSKEDDTKKEEKQEDSSVAPDESEKKEETQNTANTKTLPVFVAPVRGEVMKECSLSVPVFSTTMEDFRTHTGVDVYCDIGSDVGAVAQGTIKEIWEDPMMGTCISIEHSGGAVSVYKNLWEEIPEGIAVGTEVRGGQIIATAGESALLEIAEEAHLHLELYIDESPVDPCEYIEFASAK